MGKVTVVVDKFKLKFEVDDIYSIYKAVNELNRRMITGVELYVTAWEFISEIALVEPQYIPLLEYEWGWNVNHGLIEIDLSLGIIDNQPVLKLRFINEPTGNFMNIY